ncbi:MAG: replicative helicase [Actinomycetota bacterium]|jgi:replicative DNA helicase|nr:replicative helicase [Actinomycetota bacterium]
MGTPDAVVSDYVTRVEALTIGAVLVRPAALREILPWLRGEDFSVHRYGVWYERLRAMHDSGTPIDSLTVLTESRRHGELGPRQECALELATLEGAVPISALACSYARAVLEESLRRQVEQSGSRLLQMAQAPLDPDELLGNVELVQRDLAALKVKWLSSAGGAEREYSDRIVMDR